MLPQSRGSRRLLGELLDHADQHDGQFPATRLLSRYTSEEIDEIRLDLPRSHVGYRGKTPLVNVARLIESHGGPDAFRADACAMLGRMPQNLQRQNQETLERLSSAIRSLALDDAERDELLRLVEPLSGWLRRSTTQDGLEATLVRLEKYATILAPLPRPSQEPLRQFLARTCRDSHILDNDTILRGAVVRRIQARNPDYQDPDDAFLAEGLLRRLSGGTVLYQGSITFTDGRTQFVNPPGLAWSATDEFLAHQRAVPHPGAIAVTVENPSAWESLRRSAPNDWAIILTDGFPTRATQALVKQVGDAGFHVFHWGDIDDGGFRILEVLRRQANVMPILMDTATLVRHKANLTPFTEQKPALTLQRPECQAANELGGWLEQEALDARQATQAIIAEAARLQANRGPQT